MDAPGLRIRWGTADLVPTGSPSTGLRPSGGPAPSFSLTDQFGHRERLSDFRGRVVLLTFVDSRCTTICPLTAELLARTERALGHGYALQLLAINANPGFTSVSDVRRWSTLHRMLRRWLFLTGPIGELRTVWSSYGVETKIVQGTVAHTAVIYPIDGAGDPRGAFPIAEQAGIDAEARAIAQSVRDVASTET